MGTWIIGGLLLLITGFAAWSIHKNVKNGGCAGGCDSCGCHCEHCHSAAHTSPQHHSAPPSGGKS
ncbi:FeoB-associated Cys-rich membrane protein [Clostridiaceae bacterium NSJ-31]|uniref:FeoB-associated Cys-rich membrane protein n=1 Tax=Ligaoa zhengdingensis TaxID=2763658 RepID=A0A926DWK2_9FIRM|nr:FeoB-associated Cys-rich membrane protein [Ligaoa zhengdingensis]MBC8546076.1 FeoB-associated Cys-rich membrane protein [Ligaoa zhengdingensis]